MRGEGGEYEEGVVCIVRKGCWVKSWRYFPLGTGLNIDFRAVFGLFAVLGSAVVRPFVRYLVPGVAFLDSEFSGLWFFWTSRYVLQSLQKSNR